MPPARAARFQGSVLATTRYLARSLRRKSRWENCFTFPSSLSDRSLQKLQGPIVFTGVNGASIWSFGFNFHLPVFAVSLLLINDATIHQNPKGKMLGIKGECRQQRDCVTQMHICAQYT